MNTSTVETAFRRLGERVEYPTDIELLLVGGAAAMLTGVLPPQRTTRDCDVMLYSPERATSVVETAADKVGMELALAEGWLNSDVHLRIDTLPNGWKKRRVLVGQFGKLTVFAASRLDLIAMKVIAGRPQDLEDLQAMTVRSDDVEFVRSHLSTLNKKGTTQPQIEDAFAILDSLEVHDD